MRASRLRVVCVLLLALCLPAVHILPGYAIDTAQLSLADIEGAGWSVTGITLDLDWTGAASARAQLRAASVLLPGQLGTLKDIQLVCETANMLPGSVDCRHGSLKLQSSRLGRQSLSIAFQYRYADSQASVRIRNLRIAGGQAAVTATYRDSGWSADIDSTGLKPADLLRELQAAGIALPPLTMDGTLDVNAKLRGTGAGLSNADFIVQFGAGNFTDEAGRYAGENLHAGLTGSARQRSYGWDVRAELTAKKGAVYILSLIHI